MPLLACRYDYRTTLSRLCQGALLACRYNYRATLAVCRYWLLGTAKRLLCHHSGRACVGLQVRPKGDLVSTLIISNMIDGEKRRHCYIFGGYNYLIVLESILSSKIIFLLTFKFLIHTI